MGLMDEHLTPLNRDPAEKIQEMLKSTLESEEWRALTPNLPSANHDLLPQELNQDQLGVIINAMNNLPRPVDRGFKMPEDPIDLGETGILAPIGHGESKLCYCLERGEKKIAIILQGYQSELGVQIPQDPYLTKIASVPANTIWEYSSLRTYAMLPLSHDKALRLQEFAEPAGNGLKSIASSLRGALNRRTVTNYIAEHLPGAELGKGTRADLEIQQSRHLLTKPGYTTPVFIDIPVTQRTS